LPYLFSYGSIMVQARSEVLHLLDRERSERERSDASLRRDLQMVQNKLKRLSDAIPSVVTPGLLDITQVCDAVQLQQVKITKLSDALSSIVTQEDFSRGLSDITQDCNAVEEGIKHEARDRHLAIEQLSSKFEEVLLKQRAPEDGYGLTSENQCIRDVQTLLVAVSSLKDEMAILSRQQRTMDLAIADIQPEVARVGGLCGLFTQAERLADHDKNVPRWSTALDAMNCRLIDLSNEAQKADHSISKLNSRIDALEESTSRIDALHESMDVQESTVDNLNAIVTALSKRRSNSRSCELSH